MPHGLIMCNMYIQYNWPNVRLDKRKSSSFGAFFQS